MKNITWAKSHIYRSCQTTLLLFLRKLCQETGMPVPKSLSMVETQPPKNLK